MDRTKRIHDITLANGDIHARQLRYDAVAGIFGSSDDAVYGYLHRFGSIIIVNRDVNPSAKGIGVFLYFIHAVLHAVAVVKEQEIAQVFREAETYA